VEPSAVAAPRTRAPLALAVGGALFLMTGVALALIGAALRLQHQIHAMPVAVLGLILAVVGLALGASATVTALLDAPTGILPASVPGAWAAAAQAAAGPAPRGEPVPGKVLSSFVLPVYVARPDQPWAAPAVRPEVVPGAPLRPPGRPGPAPVPSAREPLASEGLAREVRASEVRAGYSDAGWSLEADS
jgi:hypothetical protein